MTAHLFKRAAVVTVGNIRIPCGGDTNLDVTFEVEKTLTPAPNTAKVQIFNLTKHHRDQIAGAASTKLGGNNKGVQLIIEAGYVGQTFRIFSAETVRSLFSSREGPDVITTIETGDGEKLWRDSRIQKSYAPGTSVEAVIIDVAQAMGAGPGNLLAKVRRAALKGWGEVFTGGTAVSGRVAVELTRLTQGCGLTWSIQDGSLQLLETAGALDTTAIVLSSKSGLIESPSIDQKGTLQAKTLMIPDLFPGRKVKLEAENITGVFRVKRAKYIGQTDGADWGVDIEASRIP